MITAGGAIICAEAVAVETARPEPTIAIASANSVEIRFKVWFILLLKNLRKISVPHLRGGNQDLNGTAPTNVSPAPRPAPKARGLTGERPSRHAANARLADS